MSDDWKYRDLPRAANGIAPAQWNPDTKQYEVYEGDRRILDKLERIERRLNEPLDTQLTGSNAENVELIAGAQDMFVPTGTSLQVIDLVKVSEYNFFFVQMIPVGGDEYRVTFRPTRGDTSGSLMEYEILKVSSSASNQTSKRFEVNGLKLSFYLENQMDIDHTFRSLYVFGVRA